MGGGGGGGYNNASLFPFILLFMPTLQHPCMNSGVLQGSVAAPCDQRISWGESSASPPYIFSEWPTRYPVVCSLAQVKLLIMS